MRSVLRLAALFAAAALVVSGCARRPAPRPGAPAPGAPTAPAGAITLTGAGSTFVYPFFSKAFAEYSKAKPDVRVNYLSVGSGAGIKQITEKTVDFGATDGPMTDEELQKAPGILHIPVTLGAVAVAYNVPGVPSGLKLTPEVLAGIYLGTITKWNDPKIAALNPEAKLPDLAITPVYRSDGSGTTYIFTDYLSAVSPEWKAKVGKGKSVKWPAGLGAKGNEGVSGQIKQTPGTIGYVELAYAKQNNFPVAAIRNRDGQFVPPTPEAVTAAAAGAARAMPEDLRVSIVNAPGASAYPIAGFTWALVYREQADPNKGKALADLLWWVIHEGQQYAAPLDYAPLPPEVVAKAEAQLKSLTAAGQPLVQR